MYDPTKPYKKEILELISQTWQAPYLSVEKGIYPIFKRKIAFLEVDHTDGIGTKGIFHWQARTFRHAALDALAMNLNDLAIVGAVPFKLQNHILIPQDSKEVILEIIKTLVCECKKRNIAITGGETSIHNNLEGMDISLTISGFVKKIRKNKFKKGDLIVGISSNGVHSNGFTKLRKVLGKDYKNHLKELVKPTLIYSDLILKLLDKFEISAMGHITGGAFTKLKDLLENLDVIIKRKHSLSPQGIFKEIYKRGVSDEEMYKTFNCGIGFVLSINKAQAESLSFAIKKSGFKADIIGEVVLGSGKVKIESKFSKKHIEL